MAIPWDRIRAPEGHTLPSGREPFDVAEADEARARVVPRSSGKPRSPIRRRRSERTEALALVTADVTPTQLRWAGISEFSQAYLVATSRAAVRQEPPA